MKPRWLLLAGTFTLFYGSTDLHWQIGSYLAGNPLYGFVRTTRGQLGLGSSLLSFLLDSLLSYGLFFGVYYRKGWKVVAVISYLVVGIPLMILSRYLIQEVLFYALFGYHNYGEAMRVPARYFTDNIYFAIFYSAFGIVFFFMQLSSYNQRQQQSLLLQHRTAELAFLRSQLNPHFLFNSLNNVYSLVYQQSVNALPAISKLADILRYMLYEKADTVSLAKEVQYLRAFIDLQRMRYNFDPAIQVNICLPTDERVQIPPLTLIPFVENAFKHGDLKDNDCPLIINLLLDRQSLRYQVINKIGGQQTDNTGGIGLHNVRQRLSLIYGAKHSLQVAVKSNVFYAELTISRV